MTVTVSSVVTTRNVENKRRKMLNDVTTRQVQAVVFRQVINKAMQQWVVLMGTRHLPVVVAAPVLTRHQVTCGQRNIALATKGARYLVNGKLCLIKIVSSIFVLWLDVWLVLFFVFLFLCDQMCYSLCHWVCYWLCHWLCHRFCFRARNRIPSRGDPKERKRNLVNQRLFKYYFFLRKWSSLQSSFTSLQSFCFESGEDRGSVFLNFCFQGREVGRSVSELWKDTLCFWIFVLWEKTKREERDKDEMLFLCLTFFCLEKNQTGGERQRWDVVFVFDIFFFWQNQRRREKQRDWSKDRFCFCVSHFSLLKKTKQEWLTKS